jgi:hypothetical protein
MIVRLLVGLVLAVVGAVWIGQGLGWVHGSFMTGHGIWVVFGIAAVVLGAGLVLGALRPPDTPEEAFEPPKPPAPPAVEDEG